MYNLKYAFILSLLLFLVFEVNGQSTPKTTIGPEENIQQQDSIDAQNVQPLAPTAESSIDTLNNKNETIFSDSISVTNNGDIQTTILYSARDSIDLDVQNQVMYLYGNAKIKYGDINLEADAIEINYLTNELSAKSGIDSLGKPVGNPVFSDISGTYYTEGIKYNFKTRKAIISGVVTKQDDAYIHGEKIKKNEINEVFISKAEYTTCDLPHPHYDITAKRLKMIPNDKIVSGPFQLRINEVPMPLGFAFGLFPAPRRKSSGLIIPTYGEERLRGFFLRNGGYYFAISDYVDLAVLGEIYTRGTKGLTLSSNYRKRYRYDGAFNFNYLSQRLSQNIEDDNQRNDFRLTWSHRPTSRNNRRFSANVNAATSSYNQNAVLTPIENLTSDINSNISYSMPLSKYFNINLALRHQQNVRENIINLDLPDISLNMNRIYPFQKLGNNPKAFYKKIYFAQNFNYKRRVTNRITIPREPIDGIPRPDSVAILPFNFQTFPILWRNAQTSQSEPQPLRFSFPLSTSFSAFKHFTVSPTITYTENWYFSRINNRYDPDLEPADRLVQTDVKGFSRAFNANADVTVRTLLYGFYTPQIGNIKAIRHVITPSLGFRYTPDYSMPIFGFYERIQSDEAGGTELISRYRGSPQGGEAGSITFDLKNVLEMKVSGKGDSANVDRKIPLLDELSINTSYNIYAIERNLAPIRMTARTRLFKNKVNVSTLATLDPYLYDERNQVRDEYRWNYGMGLGQISSGNININTDLNPKAQKAAVAVQPPTNSNHPDDLDPNPEYYVPWDIPWSLRVGYQLAYTKRGNEQSNAVQTLTFSGDLSITEKWKINFTSGYNLAVKEFSMTRIGILRDLHCWELNFNWTPFGYFTSYNLDIHVKAPQLKDLAYKRQRSFNDFRR
ncbi:MAG: LPS-assembly protein LptD [Bacteroidota bacterium]|nr:LPS-assembly protein LptD [Bacteroidota bacterium]